jgi:hypothetical protein
MPILEQAPRLKNVVMTVSFSEAYDIIIPKLLSNDVLKRARGVEESIVV